MSRLVLCSTLFSAALASERSSRPDLEALVGDDECAAGDETCALHAVQLRGAPSDPVVQEEDAFVPFTEVHPDSFPEVGVLHLDLPESWTADTDFPDTWDGSMAESDLLDDADVKGLMKDAKAAGDVSINSIGVTKCNWRPNAAECYLFRACRGPRYCVIHGYLIVPGFPVTGMEDITRGNAHDFDYLMNAAKDRCASDSCVLITNPVHHRTQDQLHIHYRHLNHDGKVTRQQLEHQLCSSDRQWHHFWGTPKCFQSKARIYDYMPAVFSEAAGAFNNEKNMAHVGISVFFTHACGGWKPIILATTHCSIEHDISDR